MRSVGGDAVRPQQQHAELTSRRRRRGVALVGRHDRALHENVPLPREALHVGHPGLLGELPQIYPDVLEVLHARPAHRAPQVVHRHHRGEERAAFEIGAGEPFREQIEDGEQLVLRTLATQSALALEPFLGPQPLTPAKEIENEVVLRREVAVQRHLRGARTRDHGVDTDVPHPVAAEQLIGGAANPIATTLRRSS
jgi:hypothetical protein